MDYNFMKNNPDLSKISPEKLNFLMKFAAQNKSGNAKEMSNMIMGAASEAKKEGISFSPSETDIIVEILKQNMNPEEQRKAEQLLHIMRNLKKR